ADLRYDLELSLEEAATSVEKTIEIERLETCPRCFGTGAERGSAPERCPTCGGAVRCSTHNARFLGRSHRSPPARVAAEPEQSSATPARNAAAAAGPRWRARSRSASRRESTAACACASPVRAKPGSAAVRGATSTC